MDILAQMNSLFERLAQAVIGFTITLTPLVLLACLQFSFAAQILSANYGVTPDIERWAVSSYRESLVEWYAYPAVLLAIYWLFSATLGKGAFLRVSSANAALALGILSFASAVAVATVAPPPFSAACSVLGISQTDWPPGFDTQSSCERYSLIAAGSLAVLLPALLLAISGILRVFVSRRRWRSNVA